MIILLLVIRKQQTIGKKIRFSYLIKETLGYSDLSRTYLVNKVRNFFEPDFIKEKTIQVSLKRILLSCQFENDLKKFSTNNIDYNNISEKDIRWDMMREYMLTRYNLEINKEQIYRPASGRKIKLEDLITRICNISLEKKIPIYPIHN